jgi:serine/threonine-protein kinase
MPASALIGQFIGNYKIVKELGSGAMGAVYKAEDTALGRVVAIKYLTSSRPNSRERFKREARVIGKLSHPNIVQVYNFGDHLGVPYLVVEFMAGGSLEDRVSKGGPIPWQEACHHIADAARGLAAAHREKIVHRDLKPANLLADEDGHVKVADFGLARETDDPSKLTKTGLLVGTPAYIAPEFCMGKPAGPLSDMYSLGCTLYFLLTGRLAFEAPDIVRVIRMHMTQEFPDPRKVFPEIPGEVTAILRRCCAKDPAQRFADCDEMADALEHAVHATATQTDIPVGAGLDAGLAGDFAGGPPPDAGDDPLGAAPFRRPGPGPGMTARQPPPDDGYYGPEDGDGLPARRGSDAAAMFWIIGGSVLLGIAFIVFVLLIRK